MNPEQWLQVKEIFHAAAILSPEARTAFLEQHCHGDAELLSELGLLLESHDQAEDFIEQPALAPALEILQTHGSSFWTGRTIGQYRVVREIEHGGMGIVLLAVRADAQFEKHVAIKLMRRGMETQDLLRRFGNERQILASLEHPNIARLLDGGVTEDGLPYFVMEYVEGEPLDRYCDAHQLATAERLQLFIKVCAAVQYAHQNLIVHRDLKPSNILVTPEGEPKLLDFGIAKLLDTELPAYNISATATIARLMTPEYASPEQIRGRPITTASDVYSLGVLLYRLLTGHAPYRFQDSSPQEIERLVCVAETEKPSMAISRVEELKSGNGVTRITPETISIARGEKPDSLRRRLRGDLDNIVLMALRKEPQRRYASAARLAEDINRYMSGLPVSARKDTFAYRATKFVQRNRLGVSAAALVVFTLLFGVAMTIREKRKADRRFNDGRQMANSLIFEVDDEIQKGPTRARAMLVKRTLEYLDSLAVETGNESGLQLELAAGYLKVGDIQGKPYRPNLGDTAGALASYRKAQALLESLIATSPNNLEARRYLSLCYQSIGRVQLRVKGDNDPLRSERKAVEMSEALLALNPSSAQYRNLLADNYLHFGEALYQAERGATIADIYQAIEYFRKALAIHTSLAEGEPNTVAYRYAEGVDYEYIGIAFNKIGDLTGDTENYRAALENHLRELEINEAMVVSDPTNAAYRRTVADVYGEVGLSQLKLGRTTEALENFRRKLNIFESIRITDPTNVEARRDVATANHEVAEALAKTGDLDGGLAQELKALAITQALCEAEPTNTETRRILLNSYDASGEMQEKLGDYAEALATYQKALALLESWIGAEPESIPVHRLLATEAAHIAHVYETAAVNPTSSKKGSQDNWRAAQEWYQRSLDAWHELNARSPLDEADSHKMTQLESEIAKCAAARSQPYTVNRH